MVKIYLDPGHGGTDPGAVGNGLQEKSLTLAIANKVKNLLSTYENVIVKMSRTGDKTVSLNQRTNEANKWGADLFLSVHINSANKGRGFETFIFPGSKKSAGIQKSMHDEIMKKIPGVPDRGKKQQNFHVLRESGMSAVLTESLFVSDPTDAGMLKQDAIITAIAQGHVNGIVKHYGLKKKSSAGTPSPSKPKGKLYKVQTGAFSDRKNAEGLARQLKKDGYETHIVYE